MLDLTTPPGQSDTSQTERPEPESDAFLLGRCFGVLASLPGDPLMTGQEESKMMREPLEVFKHFYLRMGDALAANPKYQNRMTELVASIASIESIQGPWDIKNKEWGMWRLGKAREEVEWRKKSKREKRASS